MKKKRTIAYVTGTRADFGLMTAVMQAIEADPSFDLQLFATGMHLMPEFGSTLTEVKKLFPSVIKLPATFDQDSEQGMALFGGCVYSRW